MWVGWLGNDDSEKNPYVYRFKHNQSDPHELGRLEYLPGAGAKNWETCLDGINRLHHRILYQVVYEMQFFGTTEYQNRELDTFSLLVLKL